MADISGKFELSIDGEKATSYVKVTDGGFMSHALIDEAVGGTNARAKHAAVADVEPITFEIGMAGAGGILRWLQDSWNHNCRTRNGQITHADFNHYQVFEHEFFDALITEATFPTLDGASKDAAYLKVKIQPTSVKAVKRRGPRISPIGGIKQKQWLCSAFRLNLEHVDGAQYVNKIESFTIKQNVKKLYTGMHRGFELTPTKLEYPNISGTIALDKADGFLKWADDYVSKGESDPKALRTGSIEFLTPDRRNTLFRIDLFGVGILKAQPLQSTANSDQIKRVKFELYVTEMRFETKGALGLE